MIGAVAVLLVGGAALADWWMVVPVNDVRERFVGRDTCARCHQQEHDKWHGSHHDLAMDVATEETVLGDFSGQTIEHYGVVSRMYRDGDKFMVHTEGPTGEMEDFEVKYVFGVEPLQQYMVEFDRPKDAEPHEIGRLQVLRISWDTSQQKWFYLSPPDVDEKLAPNDDLHWTGIAQRWNNMCADCHSTNLQKNYDEETGRYHTTFSEIDVSCEACHGPGGAHVKLAESWSLFWDRKEKYGLPRLKTESNDPQIHACAPCHSRRRVVASEYDPGDNFYNCFGNEPLQQTTYHADGQIYDEVYVHASFLQSKMYHKGIRCTDCHDAHSTRLIHEGNKVCTSCHTHPEAKYDHPAHHHHPMGSRGAMCVECHMPASTYMDVDPRRDHSLRIPRPDLSVELHTPNACTGCHLEGEEERQAAGLPPLSIDKEKLGQLKQYNDWIRVAREDEEVAEELSRLDRWAAEKVKQWYPQTDQRAERLRGPEEAAYALDAAFYDKPDAEERLLGVLADGRQPNIIRATAAFHLGQHISDENFEAIRKALDDPDPQVRAFAASAYEMRLPNFAGASGYSPSQAADSIEPLVDDLLKLLYDPVRIVRVEAARVLWRIPPPVLSHLLDGDERETLELAFDDFRQGVLVNNDRAATHLSLGILYESRGDEEEAEEAYRTAVQVEPLASGPRTNLAALLERQAERLQREARQIAMQRRDAEAAAQVAMKAEPLMSEAMSLRAEELKLLGRDASLAPDNAAIQYRYGLALYTAGRKKEAESALERAVELEPQSPDYLYVLSIYYKDEGQPEAALNAAKKLSQMAPEDPRVRMLLRDLTGQ